MANFPVFRGLAFRFKGLPPRALNQISLRGASLVFGEMDHLRVDFVKIFLGRSGFNNHFDLGGILVDFCSYRR
jgi:hypothetical protein